MLQKFFSQKGRLLSPKQKVFWQLCDYLRFWGSKSHFFQKNAFFGQKMTFFQKNYFIQNWSGIKTTSCAHTKKYIFKIKLWPCNFHQILPSYDLCAWTSLAILRLFMIFSVQCLNIFLLVKSLWHFAKSLEPWAAQIFPLNTNKNILLKLPPSLMARIRNR